MPERLNRFAPLVGVLSVAVLLVGIFSSGTSPNASASAAKIISWYTAHRSSEKAADIIFIVGFTFFVLFAGVLRSALREHGEGAATTALVGAGILSVGFSLLSVVDYALADHPATLAPAAAQALNLLDNDAFPVAAGGALIFGLGAGVAVLRSAVLPRWLGWAMLVIGVVSATPASIIGFFGVLVWTLIVSVLLTRRAGAVTATGAAAASPSPA